MFLKGALANSIGEGTKVAVTQKLFIDDKMIKAGKFIASCEICLEYDSKMKSCVKKDDGYFKRTASTSNGTVTVSYVSYSIML